MSLKQFTDEELADPRLAQFIRFFGFRPRNFDSRYPQFDPSRDFANIAMWLNTVRSFAAGPFSDYWKSIARQLMPEYVDASDEDVMGVIDEAFKALQQFIIDARGGVPLSATELPDEITIDDFVEFPVALAKLRSVQPSGMVPVLGMLGVCAVDMLFYASRSDLALGRQGLLTMDEMAPLLQKISFGIWDGKWPQDAAMDNLKEAVRIALASGCTNGQVLRIVEAITTE